MVQKIIEQKVVYSNESITELCDLLAGFQLARLPLATKLQCYILSSTDRGFTVPIYLELIESATKVSTSRIICEITRKCASLNLDLCVIGFDGGSHSLMKWDFLCNMDNSAQEEMNAIRKLQEMITLNSSYKPPLCVSMLRTELFKLIRKLSKFELHNFLMDNITTILTTDYVRKNVLMKALFNLDESSNNVCGSSKFNLEVDKLKQHTLLTISMKQELYSTKFLLFVQILVAIKNAGIAPKQLGTVELIRKHVFELLFDPVLCSTFLKGYDLINFASSFYGKSSSSQCCVFPVEDPSHVLKRLVNHMSLGDFNGADSNHWADVADSKKLNFQHTWYDRYQQNVSVSLEFISESVELELRRKGHVHSANFCKFARDLWIVWDDKRVPFQQKVELIIGYFYGSGHVVASDVLGCLPVILVESVTILICSFKHLVRCVESGRFSYWEPRSSSTNDVENYFSRIKQILGRDGRGIKSCSSVVLAHALKKCTFIQKQKLDPFRGFVIPPNKRNVYSDYQNNEPRHKREKRNQKSTPNTLAEVGIQTKMPVRSFFKK